MNQEPEKITIDKNDKKSELTCNVCKCKEFIILFNISKLEKESGEIYIGFKENQEVKCSKCGNIVKVK